MFLTCFISARQVIDLEIASLYLEIQAQKPWYGHTRTNCVAVHNEVAYEEGGGGEVGADVGVALPVLFPALALLQESLNPH